MALKKVRKAVFPVGGLGTRFLPATKSMPKEMLPVVDKPIVHYAYEEAKAAGIEQFIFVTGRNKVTIDNHFDHAFELESLLESQGKAEELELVQGFLPAPGSVHFIRQQAPLGLGHAVWCARHLIGDEPFAVILADDMVLADTPCLAQMLSAYEGLNAPVNMAAVMDVPREKTASYGILDVTSEDGKLAKAKALVEKPEPSEAPSTLSITGRYILQPDIFARLEAQHAGRGGEIQLTDAIDGMIEKHDFYGFRFDGTRFDCGERVGYIEANLAYALERADMKDRVQALLKKYV